MVQNSWGAESFVHFKIDQGRNFIRTGSVKGEWIDSSKFRFFRYNQTSSSCSISNDKLKKIINDFEKDDLFWNNIESIIKGLNKKVSEKKIFIAIDELPKNKFEYITNFHLKDIPLNNQSLIVLDCKSFETNAWKAMLTHELVHASLAGTKVSTWIEEILGQIVEHSVLQDWPIEKINKLRLKNFIPSPISQHRPFLNEESYAVNLLFGQYLIDKFGSISVLNALNPLVTEKQCPIFVDENLRDLDIFICRLKINYQSDVNKINFQILSDLNGRSLLQNFIVAMMINRDEPNSKGFYKIPNWKGFLARDLNQKSLDEEIPNKIIEIGSFYRHQGSQNDQQFSMRNFTSKASNRTIQLRIVKGKDFYIITEDLESDVLKLFNGSAAPQLEEILDEKISIVNLD